MKDVALITGASSGIGRELARVHAETGGSIIAVATNQKRLDALKQELEAAHGISVMVIVKDLTQPGASREVFEAVKEAEIEIDSLINNAGFGGRGKFHERKWEEDLAMIRLNILALTELTHLFLPGFVARNKGRILNTSSTASLVPGPLQSVYFATKAYVSSFSNALSGELLGTKVTVTNLMPGATESRFAQVAGMDKTGLFAKPATARSVAQDGYDAMMRGDMDVMSGVSFARRLMLRIAPLLPKKMILSQVMDAQKDIA
ncbi:MAG: SDR family oxidoreductase [Pseudomonadota bacterium]